MKVFILALFFAVAFSDNLWKEELTFDDLKQMDTLSAFNEWSKHFNKDYKTMKESSDRYLKWLDNVYKIADYNSKDLPFKLKLNQFGDLTGDEFRHYVHGNDGSCFKPHEIWNRNGKDVTEETDVNNNLGMIDISTLDASVDWTTKGVVTKVKNQEQCGSCWAFSATGAIECNYAIKTGKLNSLSEQQLVDCAGIRYGCQGCNGGQMSGAMQYAANEGGLCLESAYRYTARDGTCKARTCGTKYDANSGYTPVRKDSSAAMMAEVNKGCVSIGIEADQTAFQHYSSGVLTGRCGTSIDHGVLIVGYGTDTQSNLEYWKVKNSWGVSWGEEGYVRICKDCGKNAGRGECGILMEGNVPNFA